MTDESASRPADGQSAAMRPDGPSGPGAESADPASAVASLMRTLDLEPLERNLYRGRSPKVGWQRVFGGQVIGQALVAAARTIEETDAEGETAGDPWAAHSLHGYFMRPGDPEVPIIYEVDRIRDGKSFATRRVVAIQHGAAIFSMSASFHRREDGPAHQSPMPDVPAPDDLPTEAEVKARFLATAPEPVRRYWERPRPIELRPVDMGSYLMRKDGAAAVSHIWIRATAPLPDAAAVHQCVLAYASDMTLLDTSLLATGRSIFDQGIQVASLDHALWFHRPFRADEWLLYAQDSPSSGASRGFARGSIFRQDGTLVASVAQEGLTRTRDR